MTRTQPHDTQETLKVPNRRFPTLRVGRCLGAGGSADKKQTDQKHGGNLESSVAFILVWIVMAGVSLGAIWYNTARGMRVQAPNTALSERYGGTEIRTSGLVPKDGLPRCLRDVDQSHQYQILESDAGTVLFGLPEWTSVTG